MHLLLRMRPLVDLVDAALEDVRIAHVHHQGDGVVLGTRDVAEADLLVVLMVVVAPARWQSMKYFFFASIIVLFFRV